LGIAQSTIHKWKKAYVVEVQTEVEEINIAELLVEDESDVEELLRRSGQDELAKVSRSKLIEAHIDQLERNGKNIDSD